MQLRGSLQFMLKGVDFLNGRAQILSNKEVKIGDNAIRAKFILIASGARPMEIPNLRFDGKKILSSDEILNLKEIPKTLLVIGGGVIGCEFASLFQSLGTQVSIIELTPQLLPGLDKEVAKKIEVIFKKKGMRVNLNSNAVMADLKSYDLVLLCIGRVPNTQNLGLDKLGLKIEKNRIAVDEFLKTNIPNIYAAGDCIGRVMLAHFAAYQGRIAAENIAHPGSQKRAENATVPSCIFADPEIASVGLSEEEALGKGIELKINKFDFLGLSMARILDEFEGFVKIISDKKTEQILGASIIGARATELIAILTLAISSHLKLSLLRDTIFAHPTVSESIGEALAEHGI